MWLATHLRQRQKCRILQPDWMDPAVLEAAKDAEMSEPLFTDLPGGSNMFVVTNCVMDVAVSDLSKADEVKTLVKDIWDIRQSKLRYAFLRITFFKPIGQKCVDVVGHGSLKNKSHGI